MIGPNTPLCARVQHAHTGDIGHLLGWDAEGRARIQFEVDPADEVDHLDPDSLTEVES